MLEPVYDVKASKYSQREMSMNVPYYIGEESIIYDQTSGES